MTMKKMVVRLGGDLVGVGTIIGGDGEDQGDNEGDGNGVTTTQICI